MKAGFPNSSGGVTYFGEKIDFVIGPYNASDKASSVNDNVSQSSHRKEKNDIPIV